MTGALRCRAVLLFLQQCFDTGGWVSGTKKRILAVKKSVHLYSQLFSSRKNKMRNRLTQVNFKDGRINIKRCAQRGTVTWCRTGTIRSRGWNCQLRNSRSKMSHIVDLNGVHCWVVTAVVIRRVVLTIQQHHAQRPSYRAFADFKSQAWHTRYSGFPMAPHLQFDCNNLKAADHKDKIKKIASAHSSAGTAVSMQCLHRLGI